MAPDVRRKKRRPTERAIRDWWRCLGQAGSLRGLSSLLRVLPGKDREAVGRALDKEDAFTLHRQVRRHFPWRRVAVGGPFDQWQADLVDVSDYSDQNRGVRYLLCCIDAFTRFAWVRTLGSKTWIPWQCLWRCPPGRGHPAFHFRKWRREMLAGGEYSKTLQETVHRYFTAKNTRNYVDVLQLLVSSYNATHHRSLRRSPRQALKSDPEEVWYNLYERGPHKEALKRRTRRRPHLQPGDAVRISKTKGRLPDKGYLGSWSRELFKVSQRLQTSPVTYCISDLSGKDLEGTFYEEELGRAHLPTHYDIEKVLATHQKGRHREWLIKWAGYPDEFNSWTSELVPKQRKKR